MTCETFYEKLLTYIRKDVRGKTLSVDEFNELIPIVNYELYNHFVSQWETSQEASDALLPWKVFNESVTVASNKAVLSGLANTYNRIIGKPRYSTATTIDVVTSLEYSERFGDALTKPSTTHPVCFIADYSDYSAWSAGLSYAENNIVKLPDGDLFTCNDSNGIAIIPITSSTNASPIVMTVQGHGLTTGDEVRISNHEINTAANGDYTVTVLTTSTFSLDGTTGNGVGENTGNAIDITSPDESSRWTSISAGNLFVYPQITPILLDYLAAPTDPFLDYYINDTTYVVTYMDEGETSVSIPSGSTYRDGTAGATTKDSQTHDIDFGDEHEGLLLDLFLSKLGIQTRDPMVIEYSNQEIAKKV